MPSIAGNKLKSVLLPNVNAFLPNRSQFITLKAYLLSLHNLLDFLDSEEFSDIPWPAIPAAIVRAVQETLPVINQMTQKAARITGKYHYELVGVMR